MAVSPHVISAVRCLVINMKLSQITVLIITLIFCSSAFAQTSNSNIRSADFSNFTYPWIVENSLYPNESFTFKNGELPPTYDERGIKDEDGVLFENVKYGDVTGDGAEEAIVFLSISTGGSSISGIIYIYAWENNHPKLIWFRTTGDRADGGLYDIYTKNGNFVLELNSPVGALGAGRPIQFERTTYKWTGKKFRQEQSLILPIPKNH